MDAIQTPDELAGFPVVISLPILWGDQDAYGHVNNTVFIRWFESVRIAYMDQTGIRDALTELGLGPILASVTCHYRRQLRYPDTVLVGARVSNIGNTSLAMEHAVYSVSQKQLAADGKCVIVVFDHAASQSHRVPDSVREILQRVEGGSLSP